MCRVLRLLFLSRILVYLSPSFLHLEFKVQKRKEIVMWVINDQMSMGVIEYHGVWTSKVMAWGIGQAGLLVEVIAVCATEGYCQRSLPFSRNHADIHKAFLHRSPRWLAVMATPFSSKKLFLRRPFCLTTKLLWESNFTAPSQRFLHHSISPNTMKFYEDFFWKIWDPRSSMEGPEELQGPHKPAGAPSRGRGSHTDLWALIASFALIFGL